MKSAIESFWYRRHWSRWLVFPIHLVFFLLVQLRRWLYQFGVFKIQSIETPLCIIGNISVGGTGKTPFLLTLVEKLKNRSLKVVVISRGYGGESEHYPLVIQDETSPAECGDEPKMIATRSGIPVIVDPVRTRAATFAEQEFQPDIILSDDGMQHYALGRSAEICIVDGLRGFGNGWLMPVGPLREPVSRVKHCDLIIQNSGSEAFAPFRFTIEPDKLINIKTGEELPLESLPFSDCIAVCGIGNPAKFEQTLNRLPLNYQLKAFSDHHQFQASDFDEIAQRTIVMTEKDAVKCRAFAKENWWYLAVNAKLEDTSENALDQLIDKMLAP